MKLKWCLYFTIGILSIAVCFGIYERGTYTDISADDSYLEEIYVAQIPEDVGLSCCEKLSKNLPLAPIIIKVTAAGEVEHFASASRQLVKVQDIYSGTELKTGQELYVTFNRWSLKLNWEPYSIEKGFVNIMESGKEYLLFIDKQADGLGEQIPVYKLYGESIDSVIAPVFSYESHENKIGELCGDGSTYTLYNQVRENEFFAVSQKTIDAFLELKEEMLKKYF